MTLNAAAAAVTSTTVLKKTNCLLSSYTTWTTWKMKELWGNIQTFS
jgi:hypothetical protein